MANQYNLSDVFISYSRRNLDFAKKLFDRLEADGKDVWADWDDIPMTADWWQEIEAGIDAASAFVFIISPDSVASEICYKEVEYAAQNNKRIIPVLHIEVPREQQEQSMHAAIKTHNWVMFNHDADFEAGYEKLIAAVETDFAHVNTHSRLLVRSRDWISKGYDTALLLRGNDLRQASEWLARSEHADPAPVDDHRAYIDASKRNARVRRIITGTGLAVILAMTALALFALFQFLEAEDARLAADDARVEAEGARDQAEVAREQAVIARDDAEIARDDAEVARDLAERSRAETRSISFANSADEQLALGDAATALTLALEANQIPDAPPAAQQILRQIANYAPPVVEAQGSQYAAVFGEPLPCTVDDDPACIMEVAIQQGFATLAIRPDELLILYQAEASLVNTREDAILLTTENFRGIGDFTALTYDERTAAVLLGTSEGFIIYYDLNRAEVRHVFNTDEAQAITRLDFPRVFPVALNAADTVFRLELVSEAIIERGEDHFGGVNQVAFHPAADGDFHFTSVGLDGQWLLWDDAMQALIEESYQINEFVVLHAWLTDPLRALLVLDNGTIRVNEGASDDTVLETSVDGTILSAAINPARDRVAVGMFSGEVALVDLATGDVITRFEAHDRPVNTLAFHPDGTRLATGSDFGQVNLWDTTGYTALDALTGGHNTTVNALAFHPTNDQLVSAADDRSLVVWDLSDQSITLRLADHDGDIRSMAFVPPERLPGLLTGTADGTVHLWDTTNWEILQTFSGHTSTVLTIDINADGTRFATGSNDQTVIVWRLETAEEIITRVTATHPIAELTCEQRAEFNVDPLCDPPDAPVVQVEPCEAVALGASGLTVRSGPGTGNAPVWRTEPQQSFPVLDMLDSQDSNTVPWILVDLEDTTAPEPDGYLRFDFVGLNGDCTDIVDEQYIGLAPAPLADFFWVRGFSTGATFDPNTGEHWGWDLGAERGEPIYAADGGYVIGTAFCTKCGVEGQSTSEFGIPMGDSRVFSDPGWNYGYGHYMIVRYLNGQLTPAARQNLAQAGFDGAHMYCLYAHLQTLEAEEGDITATTTPIGTVGQSGSTPGPNLNLECRASDELYTIEDGLSWAQLRGGLVDPGLIYSRSLRG